MAPNEDLIYATNHMFQIEGEQGYTHVKILENQNLYVRVDLPGVRDESIRYRVDDVTKKLVSFWGETEVDDVCKKDLPREYSGSAGLGCECCEITGVDARMKDGVLRMTLTRVKVKDVENKCSLFVPPNTGKSGEEPEGHPFVVKGRKQSFVGLTLPRRGFYLAVDIPGVSAEHVQVYDYDKNVTFCAEAHDGTGRFFKGVIDKRPGSSSPATHTAECGVLKIVVA